MMDPAHIPRRAAEPAISTECVHAKRLLYSAPPTDPVSKVLDHDDLLVEIMVRLGFPTSLLYAALVSKRWFGHASDTAFLCRFRKLHPPPLLGFYVDTWSMGAPHFVPIVPQPPELASVFCHARFDVASSVMDINNGIVLVGSFHRGTVTDRVSCYPLCPERGMSAIAPFPRHKTRKGNVTVVRNLLLNEEGGVFSHCYVVIESNSEGNNSEVYVYTLQDGVWSIHMSAVTELPCQPTRKPLLVSNKIYILALSSDVLVLDLTTLSFSTFQLPRGLIVRSSTEETLLSRVDDHSGAYVIHLNKLELCIGLHKGETCSLVDTICLREMISNWKMSDDTVKDSHTTNLRLSQVGDNAEFALLKSGQCVLCLDIKCRTLRKVYNMTTEDRHFLRLHPLTMTWPPKFPVFKDDFLQGLPFDPMCRYHN